MSSRLPQVSPFMPQVPSEFLRLPSADSFDGRLLSRTERFASGRSALLRALSKSGFKGVLFVPEFFCPHLKKLLSSKFDVEYYCDLPSRSAPDFDSIRARAGDAILAANFFGVRNPDDWRAWRAENPDVVFIEDHSHAPFSEWARNSIADFSFASLRKWLPIPDGGYLRSSKVSPTKAYESFGRGAEFFADSLSASVLDAINPNDGLAFHYSAEAALNASASVSRISGYSHKILGLLDYEKIADRRLEVLKAFRGALKVDFCREITPERAMNSGFDVFAPTLKFANQSLRDKVYARLRAADIFSVIYWGGQGREITADARDEVSTIFTLPLDFRHSPEQAVEIANMFYS